MNDVATQLHQAPSLNLDALISNARFTILLGKNGSGKSTVLRNFDAQNQVRTKYITPERGGTLQYDPGTDSNMARNENWIIQDRRKNRTEYFRQQSIAQFRNLEVLVLREIEQNKDGLRNTAYSFDDTLRKINELLPVIELQRSDRGFKIHAKRGNVIPEDQISSSEAELIALAIEVLVFAHETRNNKVLFLDEPDVHLHPDLQQKFIQFVEQLAVERDFKIVIATHSTAIIGAFTRRDDLQIVPITMRGQSHFKSFKYSEICHNILPIFGAHPLSTQFNRSPVLLVEGEDDVRVFERFVRSSEGKMRFSPCAVGSLDKMHEWESWLNEFLPSIYDNPKGFSLRDLDNSPQCEIDDFGCVVRARLNCYAIENLLLTEECLGKHGFKPAEFQKILKDWVSQNGTHSSVAIISAITNGFDERRTMNIKDARNILVERLGSKKPWEVIIGQLLAENIDNRDNSSHSIREYLGPGVIGKLLSGR